MLTCGEAKGSAKSCPATDPGDRKQSFGVQSGDRAAIGQGWSAECAQQRALGRSLPDASLPEADA